MYKRFLLSSLAFGFLPSCAILPESIRDPNAVLGSSDSAGEVGSIHVDVVRVKRWETASTDFLTNNKITFAEAKSEAVAVHSYNNQLMQTAIAASLGVASNGTETNEERKIDSSVTSGGLDAPVVSSTETRTLSKTRKTPESSAEVPAQVMPTASTLERQEGNSKETGIPPAVKYATADALFRYVNTLNLDLEGVTSECGYQAYITMLKISLLPLKRRQPYDAFVDVSVVPSTSSEDAELAKRPTCSDVIVKTFSADSVENVGLDSTMQNSQNFALALALSGGLNKGKGSVQSLVNEVQRFQAIRPNSLLTMGKIGASTMRIRLGATQIGSRRYELLPITHDVALLILVPKVRLNNRYRLLSRVFYTSAHTGRYFDTPTTKREDRERVDYLQLVARRVEQDYPNLGSPQVSGCSTSRDCKALFALSKKIASDGGFQEFRKTGEEITNNYDVLVDLWQYLSRFSVDPDRSQVVFELN